MANLFNSEETHNSEFNGKTEGNVLFNDTLNTFYLWLCGVKHMVKDHMGYSCQLAARVLLYASSQTG